MGFNFDLPTKGVKKTTAYPRAPQGLLQGRTCVYFNVPMAGHINPSLHLVRRLCAEGCRVFYYTTAEFAPLIERAGAEVRIYKANLAQLSEAPPTRLLPITKMLGRHAYAVMSQDLDDIKHLSPDFIVRDFLAPWGLLVAKMQNIPSISVYDTIVLSTGTILGAIPDFLHTIPGYISDALIHTLPILKLYLKTKARFQTAITPENVFKSDFLNLILVPPFMQPGMQTLSSKYFFTGAAEALHQKPSAELLDHKLLSSVRPRQAYISLGTLYNKNISVLHRAAHAIADKFAKVIISFGGRDACLEGSLPGNVEVHKYVDQKAILRQSDLFITHAGMNSVMEALAQRIPMLLVPQMFEQAINARTMHNLGTGINLGRDPTQDAIAAAAASVLEDYSYKIQVGHLQRKLSGDGFDRACKLLAEALPGRSEEDATHAVIRAHAH